MRIRWIAMVLGLVVGQAMAQENEPVLATFQMAGQSVPIYGIGEVLGEPGENMDAFATRVAPWLRDYSATHRVEAGAMICQAQDGQFGAKLITIKSAAAIPRTTACPAGMKPTEFDIHSHIQIPRIRPSDIDKLFMAKPPKAGATMGIMLTTFSETDLDGGAGYSVFMTFGFPVLSLFR